MEINVKTEGQISIIQIDGDLDGSTAPVAQQRILGLANPGCKILLDMAKVGYMSSSGLRILLSVYRQISGNKGKVVLVGISEDIQDTMSMTGFLDFFTVCKTVEKGTTALLG